MRVRWEHSRLGAPWWDDKPVALIGGGASLKGVDLSPLREVHTVAVKGMIFDASWAELGFGLDAIDLKRWWTKLRSVDMEVWWAVGKGWRDPITGFFPSPLKLIRRNSVDVLSDDLGIISSGGSSGFGALNLAYLKRARYIILFGYDYKARNGKWHANESHYDPYHRYDPARWREWAGRFDHTVEQLKASGTEVVNASPDSDIGAFRKITVEEGLRLCQI